MRSMERHELELLQPVNNTPVTIPVTVATSPAGDGFQQGQVRKQCNHMLTVATREQMENADTDNSVVGTRGMGGEIEKGKGVKYMVMAGDVTLGGQCQYNTRCIIQLHT